MNPTITKEAMEAISGKTVELVDRKDCPHENIIVPWRTVFTPQQIAERADFLAAQFAACHRVRDRANIPADEWERITVERAPRDASSQHVYGKAFVDRQSSRLNLASQYSLPQADKLPTPFPSQEVSIIISYSSQCSPEHHWLKMAGISPEDGRPFPLDIVLEHELAHTTYCFPVWGIAGSPIAYKDALGVFPEIPYTMELYAEAGAVTWDQRRQEDNKGALQLEHARATNTVLYDAPEYWLSQGLRALRTNAEQPSYQEILRAGRDLRFRILCLGYEDPSSPHDTAKLALLSSQDIYDAVLGPLPHIGLDMEYRTFVLSKAPDQIFKHVSFLLNEPGVRMDELTAQTAESAWHGYEELCPVAAARVSHHPRTISIPSAPEQQRSKGPFRRIFGKLLGLH